MTHPTYSRRFRRARLLSILMAAVLGGAEALAGSYSQNFATGTVGTQTIGGGDTSTLSSSASTITTAVRLWAPGNKALPTGRTGVQLARPRRSGCRRGAGRQLPDVRTW